MPRGQPCSLASPMHWQITEGADNADCEGLFAYLDSRIDAFKSPTFQHASKLTLLRTCNMLLKRLSKVRSRGWYRRRWRRRL